MIHLEPLRDRSIFIVTPEGPLEKADFELLTRELGPLIASKRTLSGLMIRVKSFPGWQNPGAFVSHLRFVTAHHRQIERIAVATDSSLLNSLHPLPIDEFIHCSA